MKANRLFEKLLEHWPAKVLCFCLALILYIVHLASLLDRKTFIVPLSVHAAGALSSATNHPEYVRVTVRSKPENIAETLESDFIASIDVSLYTTGGEYSVPVTMQLAPKLLLMDPFEIKISPEKVVIRLEEKILKNVTIEPAIAGEVAHGYAVTAVSAMPAIVQIVGPQSVVVGTNRIYTGAINVNGLTSSREYDVGFENISSLIELRNAQEPVHVQVTVEPEPLARNFTSVGVRPMFLASQFEIRGELPLVSFDLTGTVPTLENYSLDENAVFIDCSAIAAEGDYELPVRFSLPNSIQVENKDVESVSITVAFRSSDEMPVEDESVQ